MSRIVILGQRTSVEEVAEALAVADPRALADLLEALGMRLGLIGGGTQFLGEELRRLAREARDELSETTLVYGRISPAGTRGS